MVATMMESLLYVLDVLFDSFETTSDDDIRNYNNVGKLCNKTAHDSGSICTDTRLPVMVKVTA